MRLNSTVQAINYHASQLVGAYLNNVMTKIYANLGHY